MKKAKKEELYVCMYVCMYVQRSESIRQTLTRAACAGSPAVDLLVALAQAVLKTVLHKNIVALLQAHLGGGRGMGCVGGAQCVCGRGAGCVGGARGVWEGHRVCVGGVRGKKGGTEGLSHTRPQSTITGLQSTPLPQPSH